MIFVKALQGQLFSTVHDIFGTLQIHAKYLIMNCFIDKSGLRKSITK